MDYSNNYSSKTCRIHTYSSPRDRSIQNIHSSRNSKRKDSSTNNYTREAYSRKDRNRWNLAIYLHKHSVHGLHGRHSIHPASYRPPDCHLHHSMFVLISVRLPCHV